MYEHILKYIDEKYFHRLLFQKNKFQIREDTKYDSI